VRRVHAKSSAQAPNKKRHLCVPEPELRLHHILGPAFCSSDQTSYSQKREVLHPSTGTRPVYYTHILYSLLISRWDRQSGAAESAPLYTNHFIARRPYNIPWWAWSLRPRRPTMSCAAPPPPPPAAGRQGLHCYTLCCESLRPALIAQSTITHALHIRWSWRGKSWKNISQYFVGEHAFYMH
jgi:hypothetical protein